MLRAGLIAAFAIFLVAAAPIPKPRPSQEPAPSPSVHQGEPQAHAARAQPQAAHNTYGTKDNPAFVQLEDSQQQKDEAAKHATYEKKEATNNRLIAVFTIVLGIVGVLELLVLALQIYWMSRTVIDSNKQHASTERAYIVPGTFNREISTRADALRAAMFNPLSTRLGVEAGIPNAELEVTFFAVQPVWANMGNTATAGMRIRVDWSDGEDRPAGSYRQDWQQFFVAPKSSETSEFIEMPGLDALIQGGAVGTVTQMPLRLIWGIAEYEDVFGKKHWLHWCYRIRPSRPVPGQGILISFIQWGDYNASGDEV
jgi:hypothetical protein